MDNVAPLRGPIRKPRSGGQPRRLVILLHGLGSDGQDLIGLAPHWEQLLPDAQFMSPNAPFPCDMAPMGYQWFSLRDFGPAGMLEGARRAAPLLDAYIDQALADTGVPADQVALVGFSQGTMMALFVALRRGLPIAGVLGYSGALVGAESLANEITAKPPVMLIHGDADDVVPVAALHQAVDDLGAAGLTVEWHVCPGLGHSIDTGGLASGGRFLSMCFGAQRQP